MSHPSLLSVPQAPLDVAQIRFRQMHGEEIARVMHLREELQLPDAVRSDPGFIPREKKR